MATSYSYGAPLTPVSSSAEIEAKRRLARLLAESGMRPNVTTGGWGGAAQGLAAVAQAGAGAYIANQADKERNAATERGFEAVSRAGLDPQRLELARAMGEPGLEWAFDALTSPEDTDLVQVVENGRKVWKRKSEAAGAQSDFPEAPKTRDRFNGTMMVQEEFDPASGTWQSYGQGARWQTQQPGADAAAWETIDMPGVGKVQRNKRTGKIEGLPNIGDTTPSQQAGNAEVDAARQYLLGNNLSMEEIQRRTQETTSTGRENVDYDPYLAKTFNLALSHKVGDDPEFDTLQRKYRGSEAGTGAGWDAGGLATGTRDNPLVPMTQADIDNAPSGTVIRGADGTLFVKP